MPLPELPLALRLRWLSLVLMAVPGIEWGHGLASFTLTAPVSRQVVQRDTTDRADLRIQGTWSSTAARIEARVIVMPGTTNNGATSEWSPVAELTGPGPFSGVLPRVVAGGWYSLQLRALDGASNELGSATVDRVGVGDVFITAGQSNAGCFGSPTQRPDDDRISAYTLTSRTWRWATDPQPDISGAMGGGGSAWPRLGSLLVQSNQVPVGFIGLAAGATTVAQWAPGTGLYRNLTNTLVRFGPQGVRAVLWHQGESDALESTSAVVYAQRMSNIVSRARLAAAWSVPWGIAEASFHPGATRAQEEAVAAGQRLFTASTPDCFRGPRTDDFNLEGKLSDTVHFNTVGLSEHALQWTRALIGYGNLTPKNGDFESNTPLPEGTLATASRVIGWNRLNGAGTGIGLGANGTFNPDSRTYPGTADGVNGGVLPNMSGRHVGTLGSTATNSAFLQTLQARLQPSTVYRFSVALGVRTNDAVFGGYRLDFLANGQPIGNGITGTLSDLNLLAGGNASGAFTRVSCVVTSAVAVPANQPLAIRISKPGGGNTYLDFDHVEVSSHRTPYGQWQELHWNSVNDPESLPEADPDADGLPNLVEALIAGLDPRVANPAPKPSLILKNGEEFLEFRWPRDPAPGRGTVWLRLSHDLITWHLPANSPAGDVVVVEEPGVLGVQFRRRTLPAAFLQLQATP